MKRDLKEAILHRRSYYAISNLSPVSDAEIREILNFAVKNVPSAFNSQTTRVVLLLKEQHTKLWNIVKETLRKIVPPKSFESTNQKINSFSAGYGTILYFEEQNIIQSFQENFPLYADNFPVWSEQTSAMHQFAIWTMLEDAGLGASLQHYNPLIDKEVRETWKHPDSWRLIAQMPFGKPVQEPEEKSFKPIEERVLVFK
jgi:predicted oxidoreductase (fatty acid repression mutant protein)